MIAVHQSYTKQPGEGDNPVPAILKLDQAYIAVGGREHLALIEEIYV